MLGYDAVRVMRHRQRGCIWLELPTDGHKRFAAHPTPSDELYCLLVTLFIMKTHPQPRKMRNG